jgi:hypothetical protein
MAIVKAADVLEFAAADWSDLNGDKFPPPRTMTSCVPIPIGNGLPTP